MLFRPAVFVRGPPFLASAFGAFRTQSASAVAPAIGMEIHS